MELKTSNGIPYKCDLERDGSPKMQLGRDCPVTKEFRVEINKWMGEFFGFNTLTLYNIPDYEGRYVNEAVYLNEKTFAHLVKTGRVSE